MNTSFEIFHSANELDQKLWNSNLDLNHIFLESEFLKNFSLSKADVKFLNDPGAWLSLILRVFK